jgi:Dolichyl-phosphate-mannose-protein mannosyltransferase
MAEEVGGQMETVPTRQSLFGPDYLRLGILLVVAAAIHVWLVVHTAVPARDSLGYARIALNISDPSRSAKPGEERGRIDVIKAAEQPPGYPVAVWFTEIALRSVTKLSLADRSLLATQVANAFAAVLLVIPLYLTGRILAGRNVGFAAALLFEVLPVPARVTSDGLSEGVYLLVVCTAIMLGVRAARKPGIGGFLLCGMATGASYLVRPEGLMVVIAVGSVIFAAGLYRRWPRDVALARLTALGVGLALVAVPYMVLIGKLSNKPTAIVITEPFNNERPGLWKNDPGANAGGGGCALFAAWWDPQRDEGKNRLLWAIEAVWSETFKSLHYIVGALAIFALFAHRQQLFSPDPGMWVLVILGAFNLLLLVYLAAKIGYVSERHTVLFTMICCLFAATSFEPLAHVIENLPKLGRLVIWPKAAPGTLFVALVLSALPYTIKPMHPQREGHRHAGLWLEDKLGKDDNLVDPLTWGEWYAGRTLYQTVKYRDDPDVTWTIIESGKTSPHSRLPQWENAKDISARGELVYRWPADAPPHAFAVEVYKITRHATAERSERIAPPPHPAPGQKVVHTLQSIEKPD